MMAELDPQGPTITSKNIFGEGAADPLDGLSDLLPIGVCVCDQDGLIVRFNRRAARLWGRTPSLCDPLERFCGSYRLYRLDGAPLPHADSPMADVLKTGFPVRNHEIVMERPDGSRIVVLVHIDALRDEAGAVAAAVNCFRDVTERRRTQERQQLLLREMNHRVKNLLALANGVVTLSARTARTPRELADTVRERLSALARAYDLTLPDSAGGDEKTTKATTLHALIRTIISPYGHPPHEEADRIRVAGPMVRIGTGSIANFALLLHEFATNAVKYGALSTPDGHVDIEWSLKEHQLRFVWSEHGGPPIKNEKRSAGFGSLLASAAVEDQLGGRIDRDWKPEGLTIHLSVPIAPLSA